MHTCKQGFTLSHLRKSLTEAFFCSPHITTLRERISVDGRPITQPAFDALVEGSAEDITAVRRDEAALSHFEAMTALALRHFKDEQVHKREHSPEPKSGELHKKACA